ncbi:putative transposase [Glaesserella parasuis MN-H]|nr:putative transposase [Glaesserella parasuis MN-H]
MSDWLSKAEEWKGIKSVLEVCRKRSDNGKESQEKVFYISSLDVDIQILAFYAVEEKSPSISVGSGGVFSQRNV